MMRIFEMYKFLRSLEKADACTERANAHNRRAARLLEALK